MRKQNSGMLVGQASLYKLWNTSKNAVAQSDPNADLSSEDTTPTVEAVLSQPSRSSSTSRDRGGGRLPLNPAELDSSGGRSRKSKRERNSSKSKHDGSQTKLATMFQPKPATGEKVGQQDSHKTSRAEDAPTDERNRTLSRQLKRNHSTPSQSLLPLPEPAHMASLSQPITSTPAIIDISDEEHTNTKAVGSRNAPIPVDVSPQKPSFPSKQAKPSKLPPSSFFDKRRRANPIARTRALGEGTCASYPDTPDGQHARGPQRTFHCSSPVLPPSRSKPPEENDEETLTPDISRLQIRDTYTDGDTVTYDIEALGFREGTHAMGNSILESYEANPAFTKFLCPDHDIAGTSWNERWHPRCAAEVLGNRDHALFLRDWLLALEIRDSDKTLGRLDLAPSKQPTSAQTQKRPAIIRSVAKPRKRRRVDSDDEDLDGWMVSDEEEEPEEEEDDEEEEDMELRFTTPVFTNEETCEESVEGGSPWKPKRTRIVRRRPPDSATSDSPVKEESAFRASTHDFSDRLSNCILLAGPPGVGKTAAVYACAEELGWEVFEVYPGIGKRNGSSLLSLVGDVTKNHIVKRGNAPTTQELDSRASRMSNFFQRKTQDVLETSAFVATPLKTDNTESEQKSALQSIILLEEVDILFSEDGGFWQTVVTLIKESRRPVVMTCNDLSLVPIATLPLQEVLHFKPAAIDEASAYLQCMMIAIGYNSSREHMRALYRADGNTEALDAGDTLLRSHMPSADITPPDLRQAINNLQFLCQAVPGFELPIPAPRHTEVAEELLAGTLRLEEAFDVFEDSISEQLTNETSPEKAPSLQKLWRISEALSAVESHLGRSPINILKTHSLCNEVSGEEEQGHVRLEPDFEDAHHQDGIAFFNSDEAFTIEACEIAKKVIRAETRSSRVGRSSAHHHRLETRAQPKGHGFLYDRGVHMARSMRVMDKLVSLPARQSLDSIFLDYEPWTRAIDRSDTEQEKIAVGEAEMRAANNGGRMTRNSNRAVYVRYFCLEDEERRAWQADGLGLEGHVGE